MKVFEVDDEKRLASVYDKRMGADIEGEALGDAFKGYVFRLVVQCARFLSAAESWEARARVRSSSHTLIYFLHPNCTTLRCRITGGNDKQGFPMQQGILVAGRVRLLMSKGSTYYRPRRVGERRRKSVRGCIVGSDIAILNLVVVKHGDAVIEGLTDPASVRPRRLGPKRAQKIRKLFNLTKENDVRKFVISREFTDKKGRKVVKRPNIQRLVTPLSEFNSSAAAAGLGWHAGTSTICV